MKTLKTLKRILFYRLVWSTADCVVWLALFIADCALFWQKCKRLFRGCP